MSLRREIRRRSWRAQWRPWLAAMAGLLLAGPLVAQSSAQNNGSTSGTASGAAPRGAFGYLLPGGWTSDTLVELSQMWDNNVFLDNAFQQSDEITSLDVSLSASLESSRTQFNATYVPAYSFYRRYRALNYFAQTYTHALSFRLTRHTRFSWDLNMAQYPMRGNLPFVSLNFMGMELSFFSLQALANNTNIANGTTSFGLEHDLNRHSRITAQVGGELMRFSASGQQLGAPGFSYGLSDSYAGNASLSWAHDLSRTRSISVSASDSYLDYINPRRQGRYEALDLGLNQRFWENYTFSVGAGPALSQGVLGAGNHWEYDLNLGLQHSSAHSTLGVTWSRRAQLGLLPGAVAYNTLGADGSYRFSRSWRAALRGGYALSGYAGQTQNSFRNYFGSAQLSYAMGSRWAVLGLVTYMHQPRYPTPGQPLNTYFDRWQASVGLVHDFGNLF